MYNSVVSVVCLGPSGCMWYLSLKAWAVWHKEQDTTVRKRRDIPSCSQMESRACHERDGATYYYVLLYLSLAAKDWGWILLLVTGEYCYLLLFYSWVCTNQLGCFWSCITGNPIQIGFHNNWLFRVTERSRVSGRCESERLRCYQFLSVCPLCLPECLFPEAGSLHGSHGCLQFSELWASSR